jgi:hypothetical protein
LLTLVDELDYTIGEPTVVVVHRQHILSGAIPIDGPVQSFLVGLVVKLGQPRVLIRVSDVGEQELKRLSCRLSHRGVRANIAHD